MGRKSAPGSRIRDEQPGSYFPELFGVKILKFYDADPGSGIRDGKSRIRDKHPGSATLLSGESVLVKNLLLQLSELNDIK
jgi:hypothetical protein